MSETRISEVPHFQPDWQMRPWQLFQYDTKSHPALWNTYYILPRGSSDIGHKGIVPGRFIKNLTEQEHAKWTNLIAEAGYVRGEDRRKIRWFMEKIPDSYATKIQTRLFRVSLLILAIVCGIFISTK